MPIDEISEIESAILYTQDGEKVLDLGKGISTYEVSLSDTHFPDSPFKFSSFHGEEFSIDINDCEMSEELLEMFRPARIIGYELRQNKSHRRKRINKKWAKRYGHTLDVYVG